MIPLRIVLAILCVAMLPTLAAAAELKPFTATYSISTTGFHLGTARIQLEALADDRWSYRFEPAPRALIRPLAPARLKLTLQSVFRIQNGQLFPESFIADDGTSNNSKGQHLVFDWAAGRVRGTVEREPVDVPTQPGLLDEVSVQVALMHALLSGRTPEGFLMLDEDRVKDYLYTTEGKERLKTDVGEYDTVIFRSSRPDSSKGTWFWCAPELGYLPLKIERRDGKDVQMTMRMEQVTR